MTDKPIIFSAPMVRALLDGRKSQTRRVIKLDGRRPEFCGPRGCEADPTCWGWEDSDHGDWVTLEGEPGQRMCWRDWRGAYAPGDRLWVREGHAMVPATAYRMSEGVAQNADPKDCDRACIYREGWDRSNGGFRWRSPIHMPRWASRLTLTVTDVRVQRVQEISEADAIAEGVVSAPFPGGERWSVAGGYDDAWLDTAREAFRCLWYRIHGPGAWGANPWVAAISFTVERRNIDEVAG